MVLSASPSRRGPLVVLAVVLVLACVAAALWWFQFRSDATAAGPDNAELPAQVADDGELQDYFAGPGKPILGLLDVTDDLSAGATKADCLDVAADLNKLGRPRQLTAAADGVPDPNVRDAAINHVGAVIEYLSSCGAEAGVPDDAEHARFTSVILHRFLARAGVV